MKTPREKAASFRALTSPDWLNARPRELWKPLLALASLADEAGTGLGIGRDLLALAAST